MTAVQTTNDTAVITFASEEAAKAAENNIKVERFNPDKETKTEMRSTQKADGNTVKVTLYTDYAKNTDYVFTTSDANVTLSVGSLEIVKLGLKAINQNTNSTTLNPNVDSKIYVTKYAQDADGNFIDMGYAWIGEDDITLRTEDFAKGTLSGHDLYINNAGDAMTVVASYGKTNPVTATETFVAEAVTFEIIDINRAAIARSTSSDGGSYTDITTDAFTSGKITFPKGDEARLYLEINTNGKKLVTNKFAGFSGTTHKAIENTEYFGNDVYTISYESKNPNILMIHPVDGTAKAVAEGTTEIIVYVTKTTATGSETRKLGAILVEVTGARYLYSVTPLDSYQSTLNGGNFTNVTYSFMCRDQYGAAIDADFEDVYYNTGVDVTAVKKTMVQRNTVESAVYPNVVVVNNAPLSPATLENGTAGIAKITLQAKTVTASDRYTLKVTLKKGNDRQTAYSYLRVVNAPTAGTVSEAVKGTIVAVNGATGHIENPYYDASKTYDVHDILGTGSYTYNLLANGKGNTDTVKIAVVTYSNGLPFEVQNFVVLDATASAIQVQDNALANIFNGVAAPLVSSIGAYSAYDVATLNASALSRNNTKVFVLTIKDTLKNTYADNANLVATGSRVLATSAAVVAITKDDLASDERYNVIASSETANKSTISVASPVGKNLVNDNDNYKTRTYALELKAPALTVTSATNIKAAWSQTIPGSQFSLTMNRNVVDPTIITKSNTTSDSTALNDVLLAVLDKVTAPINWSGADMTFAVTVGANGNFNKSGSNALVLKTGKGKIGSVTITLPDTDAYRVKNVGKDGYTVVGVYVVKVDITVTLDDGTNYTVTKSVGQYVQY